MDDYHDRRRALDEQYLAAMELLREGYVLRVAELDRLRSSPAPPVAVPPTTAPTPRAFMAPEARRKSPTPSRPSTMQQERMSAPEVKLALMLALPDLPEKFDNSHIYRAIGFRPSRATLARAIAPLLENGFMALEEEARGRRSNVYRKDLDEAAIQLLREKKAQKTAASSAPEEASDQASDPVSELSSQP